MENEIIWSPGGLLGALNQTLEYAYSGFQIEGEVSGFKINQQKYIFFDLKDDEASLSCFMMVFNLRQPIQDGMRVRVHARAKVTKFSKLSLVVDQATPVGEGDNNRSQQLLKEKLDKEGLFSPERKRPLPQLPNIIGLISSEQAAGYADFNKILNDRWGGLKILFKHTQVQGDSAPDQIIAAIEAFNQSLEPIELIAIVRGGGSADDLACFNDERLVRAIASSRIPIITGIGHDIDESLSDLAADVSAATPTHAAQIIVPDRTDFVASLSFKLKGASALLSTKVDELGKDQEAKVGLIRQKIEANIEKTKDRLALSQQLLESYNPSLVLMRGYAMIKGELSIGSFIEVETKDKLITAEVKNVQTKNN